MTRIGLILGLGLAVTACAKPPEVIAKGELGALRGKRVALLTVPQTSGPADQPVMTRLQALGAQPAGDKPEMLIQVALSDLPTAVGVSGGAGAEETPKAWIAAPGRSRMGGARPGQSLSVVALDAATGLPAYQVTATDHRKAFDAKTLARLLDAALPVTPPAS
ncbi:hypothetical protein P7B02_04340 [Caulobacter segnis]|uniref:hypothetical protein n=1 Tax=Caulobacter segnis TaxID=88688 RepID=UPI0024105D5F|nr:hypothetical protein [Caulobacter segnis]MDG2520763.1 hypothetical protein [Caulobacter segnis]